MVSSSPMLFCKGSLSERKPKIKKNEKMCIISCFWSNGVMVKALDFQFRGSWVQNHWLDPISTELFILQRSIKWVPGIYGDLKVKNKLYLCSGLVALKQLKPIHKMGAYSFFKCILLKTSYDFLKWKQKQFFYLKKDSS